MQLHSLHCLRYGLSISPTTGALELAPGCSEVGCGVGQSIEVKCVITAEQEGGLTSSATVDVLAGDLSYGSGPVLLRPGAPTSLLPSVNTEKAGPGSTFQGLSCIPGASSWLALDSSSGKLSLKSGVAVEGALFFYCFMCRSPGP